MTEVERYLFDLQGYLIVEDVLDVEDSSFKSRECLATPK